MLYYSFHYLISNYLFHDQQITINNVINKTVLFYMTVFLFKFRSIYINLFNPDQNLSQTSQTICDCMFSYPNLGCCVVVPVSRPYAMSELWGGGVPTSNSGQLSPRRWVPSLYSLSPTRRSKPAFQWQGTNERIHRQWQQGTKRTQDRHGGHQFTYGSSVTSLVTGGTVFFSEQPGETITQQRGNSLLCVSLNIWIYPSESFSGFGNRGPEPVTPSKRNTKVFRSDH